MPSPKRPLIEARRDQVFPTLEPEEVERVRRFGEVRSYRAGEALVTTGEVGHGLALVLSGAVTITRRDELDRREPIVRCARDDPLAQRGRGVTPCDPAPVPVHRR
ncbi:MAG: cyclic nucleotide-binding domain-containing protein [Deltaproteobacteria bacterium]|nr:MAG: cyclic nucleotide-binding domain-containing protein [Deltaproteobacteria bacterium]